MPKVTECRADNCTQTRVGPDKSWHGRLCGGCKNQLEANKRNTQTFQSWKAKVDRTGVWGKQPQPRAFLNAEEHQQALESWSLLTALTFDTWLDGHKTRKNAKGLSSRASLNKLRPKFRDDTEFQRAMHFWETNHKNTQSYINVLQHQRHNKEHNKQVRIQNGTGLETRICQHTGCTTQATFGSDHDNKRVYCVRHKLDTMVGLGKQHCTQHGFTTRPCYGPTDGTPEVCALHARTFPDYVDLITSRCRVEGCMTSASYGTRGTTTRTHCSKHGKPLLLVDIVTDICSWDGCTVSAGFGFGEGRKRERCVTHKEPGMVNVHHPACQHEGCTSIAHYAQLGQYSTWCDKHKIQHDGVIFNPTKTCIETNCRQYASHGHYHNPIHCVNHVEDKDICLIESTCATCNLVDICLHGKCEHCSSFRASDRRYDERHVKHLFDTRGIDYVHEEVIGDTRLVPDFIIRTPTHSIVVEIDENQHRNSKYTTSNARYQSHDAEHMRMVEIHKEDAKISTFIRYNPDDYAGGSCNTNERHAILMDVIQHAMTYNGPPRVVKLFYDDYTTPEFTPLF